MSNDGRSIYKRMCDSSTFPTTCTVIGFFLIVISFIFEFGRINGGLLVIGVTFVITAFIWKYNDVKERRKKNSIGLHKLQEQNSVRKRNFEIFDLGNKTKVVKFRSGEQICYPSKYTFMQACTGSNRYNLVELKDINSLLATETFKPLDFPIVTETVDGTLYNSHYFIRYNDYFIPKNYVVGLFVTSTNDRIQLVLYSGNIFSIRLKGSHLDNSRKELVHVLLMLFPQAKFIENGNAYINANYRKLAKSAISEIKNTDYNGIDRIIGRM